MRQKKGGKPIRLNQSYLYMKWERPQPGRMDDKEKRRKKKKEGKTSEYSMSVDRRGQGEERDQFIYELITKPLRRGRNQERSAPTKGKKKEKRFLR